MLVDTLRAIAETFTSSLSDKEFEQLLRHCQSFDPQVSQETLREFSAFSAADLPDAGTKMLDLISKYLPPSKATQLSFVVGLLGTSIGTRLICGTGFKSFVEFATLDKEDRERALLQMSKSILPQIRILFRVFHAMSCLTVYGENWKIIAAGASSPYNPSWKAIGYAGPVPERERPAAENIWQPPFLNVEEVAHYHSKDKLVLSYDAVVVGSGAGGGLVASQLAKAGFRVLLVDKARYTHPSDYPLTEAKSFELLYERSGLLGSDDGGMQILAGTAWGGGTTVNWSASLEPPPSVRKEWSQKHGLTYFDSPAFQADIAAVQERLGIDVKSISHNVPNQILINGCQRLGYDIQDIPQNTAGHTHDCGYCTWGCPYAEKQSSLITWIKDAVDAGCHLVQGGYAESIDCSKGKVQGVRLKVNGQYDLYVKAKRVVVACGAVNTPALLLRSKLPNPNIGKNLALHPVVATWGFFPERIIRPHHGSIMTAVSKKNANVSGDGYGSILEVPTLHPSMFLIHNGWESAVASKSRMAEFNHSSLVIAITRDKDSQGSVTLDTGGTAHITWRLGAQDSKAAYAGLEDGIRVLLAAGAKRVTVALDGALSFERKHASYEETINSAEFKEFLQTIRAKGVVQTRALVFSAHQMGTCRMGTNKVSSVVKPTGESWDVSGLYVADGSVFPTASGVNPMLTIYSVAHFIGKNIVQDMSKTTARL